MKRIVAVTLASLMLLGTLTACGGNGGQGDAGAASPTPTAGTQTPTPTPTPTLTPAPTPTPTPTPSQGTEDGDTSRGEVFRAAIEGARTEEENEVFSIVTAPDDMDAELYLTLLGLTAEDMTDFAISISPMNIRAYGIAVITPAEGREDAVKEALNGFVELQKSNFERYLEDQYAIAQAALVETLDDGTVVMVMSEGQDDIFSSIETALAENA